MQSLLNRGHDGVETRTFGTGELHNLSTIRIEGESVVRHGLLAEIVIQDCGRLGIDLSSASAAGRQVLKQSILQVVQESASPQST